MTATRRTGRVPALLSASSIAKLIRTDVSEASPRSRYRRDRSANSRLGSPSACACSIRRACVSPSLIERSIIDSRRAFTGAVSSKTRRANCRRSLTPGCASARSKSRSRSSTARPICSRLSCPEVTRGWVVNEVPNRSRLTIVASSPCATRARVAASAAAIQRVHSSGAGMGTSSAAKTGAACACDRYVAGEVICADRIAKQERASAPAVQARLTPTTIRTSSEMTEDSSTGLRGRLWTATCAAARRRRDSIAPS